MLWCYCFYAYFVELSFQNFLSTAKIVIRSTKMSPKSYKSGQIEALWLSVETVVKDGNCQNFPQKFQRYLGHITILTVGSGLSIGPCLCVISKLFWIMWL